MRVLFVATVRSHIGQFHMPFIKRLKELGCTVDAAYKDNSADKQGLDTSAIDNVFEVPFSRSPYSLDNIKAYKVLKKILQENDYDAVHCHTPMGAVVTRLAAKSLRKKGLKVIYTAHGFHFYKGASKFNWLVFYNIEKYLSKYTDCLITINKEDYTLAKEKGFKAGKILYVPGVGVDLSEFSPKTAEQKATLRSEYGYSNDDFIMIYPADFCQRKNQMMLLKALQIVTEKYKDVKLLLPGLQTYMAECEQFCKDNGLSENVEFMGYRRDIYKLDALADVSVSSSRQEGLPINLIEAMALGNPIIATDVRGNNDLVVDGKNGYLVPLNDSQAMAERIIELIENPDKIKQLGDESLKLASQYGVDYVLEQMTDIYKSLDLIK
ncbi:MAG: glycosyltransferase family 4 protein [Eubacteriales bacterium]|nr:glycosyltransferase family 4 protein [Eubacteriales bacterium]